MNNLYSLIKEIETATKTANMVLDEMPWQTRAGMGIAIGEAKEKVIKLTKQYEDTLKDNLVGVFPMGPKEVVDEFIKAPQEFAGSITVAINKMYYNMAETIYPTLVRDRILGGDQYPLIVSELRTIMSKLNIQVMNMPKPVFPQEPNYDIQQLATSLKGYLESALDVDLNKMYLMKEIIDTAIAKKYTQNVVSVIVTGAKDEAEMNKYAELFQKGVFAIVMDQTFDTSKENALKLFNGLKKKLVK